MRLKGLLGGLTAFVALSLASVAFATGGVHIEWMRNGVVVGAQTITATSASVASSAAPSFGGSGGQARITVTQGAVVMLAGAAPVATQTNGIRLAVGMSPVILSVNAGDEVAIIEATDAPPSAGSVTVDTSALALDTSVNGVLVAQGSTTSGEKGTLGLCAATTSAPSYTTGQTDPESCDLSGQRRVVDQAVINAVVAGYLTPPLAVTGSTSTHSHTTITTGGTAQNLFSGATPTNGYEVCNPSATEDAWISETTTAAANTGYRIPANGGCYSPPDTARPAHAISAFAATTAHPLTVRSW